MLLTQNYNDIQTGKQNIKLLSPARAKIRKASLHERATFALREEKLASNKAKRRLQSKSACRVKFDRFCKDPGESARNAHRKSRTFYKYSLSAVGLKFG